tara:strand:- start:2301 stop:2837 length:537 start_codon:yes stop_codon:yes gene_type:complete
MKHTFQIYFIFLFCLCVFLSSCKKDIEGCTDNTAMNYDVEANLDNGSCIYFYDIAQGLWDISPDCEEYTIPIIGTTISLNDQLPESIDVQGGGNNMLYIDINGTQVNGSIDSQGNLTVPSQTIQIDMGFGPMDIDVEGSGVIESDISGNLDLTYAFEIEAIPGFPIEESLDCAISLSK